MSRSVAPQQSGVQEAAADRTRLRRTLHPWAWWVWAIGGMVVASLTRNLLLLALVMAAVWFVTALRRTSASWARSIRAYAWLALVVIGIRVVLQVLVGGLRTGHVLFRLPTIPLPAWFAGIQLGGPVTAEALFFTVTDAGRLAILLFCVGAANTLANPRRAFRSVPRSLHRIATAVVIALSVAPQLVESAQRVTRAQRLRGAAASRRHALRSVVIPVLEDSVERSMSLAASMESRGFGRTGAVSRYRPDPWRLEETGVVVSGLVAAGVAAWMYHYRPDVIWPDTSVVAWPPLTPALVVIALLLAAPALISPPPSREDA